MEMTKQEEIREGMARYHYDYPDGRPTIRVKWELLSDDVKKPYLDIADLELFYLHSQDVVIKVDRKCMICGGSGRFTFVSTMDLSTYEGDCLNCKGTGKDAADYVAVESLIKEENE